MVSDEVLAVVFVDRILAAISRFAEKPVTGGTCCRKLRKHPMVSDGVLAVVFVRQEAQPPHHAL